MTTMRETSERMCAKIHPYLTSASPGYEPMLAQIELMLKFMDEYERMRGGRHHPPSADDPALERQGY